MNKILIYNFLLVVFSSCSGQSSDSFLFTIPERTTDIMDFETKYFGDGVELGLSTDLFCAEQDSIAHLQLESRIAYFSENEGNIELPYLVSYRSDYCPDYDLYHSDPLNYDLTLTDCRVDNMTMVFGFSNKQLEKNGWEETVSLDEAMEFYNKACNLFKSKVKPEVTTDHQPGCGYLTMVYYPECEKFNTEELRCSFYSIDQEFEQFVERKAFFLTLFSTRDSEGHVSYSILTRYRIFLIYV